MDQNDANVPNENSPIATEPVTTTQMPSPDVPNYLIQSILVTICCCLPLGIAAIIFAAQVNSKAKAGDLTGAKKASDTAKKLCWIGFILGLIGAVISIAINIVIPMLMPTTQNM